MTWFEAAFRWYAVLVLVSWSLAPVARWLGIALADRGVTISRPLGLLMAIYPAWLLASLGVASYDSRLIVATVVVAGALSWFFAFKTRFPAPEAEPESSVAR